SSPLLEQLSFFLDHTLQALAITTILDTDRTNIQISEIFKFLHNLSTSHKKLCLLYSFIDSSCNSLMNHPIARSKSRCYPWPIKSSKIDI
ncbi:hypothetical protein BDFB_014757, partial [Asbolus verrucosus]